MNYAILIYNPTSGMADIADRLDFIISRYARAGYTILPLRTTREKNFYSQYLLPAIAKLSPAHILIAGGDGTLNRYINFAVTNGVKIPIAIIPTGTSNDFARMIGMRAALPAALDRILSGQPHKIDLGRVNDKYFINILSGGLMTDVSQRTPTALKNIFGRVAYFFNVIGDLPLFRRMQVTVSSSSDLYYSGDCLMFMVFNGRTAGNLSVAKNSSPSDGLFEVIIVKGDNIAQTIGALFQVLLKNKGHFPDDIVHFQASRIDIECKDAAPTDIDGEAGPRFPMRVECLSGEIEVIY